MFYIMTFKKLCKKDVNYANQTRTGYALCASFGCKNSEVTTAN